MNLDTVKSSAGIEPSQITIAKTSCFCLYSSRSIPVPTIEMIKLLSDAHEVVNKYQPKDDSARLALSEKPF
jgi:hypothetical protein